MRLLLVIVIVTLWPALARAAEDEPALSKKAAFLKDKDDRENQHALRVPHAGAPDKILTLHNMWTSESLPVTLGDRMETTRFDALTRCHYTNQATVMDQRLYETILRAADKFKASYIEIVSGFRAPKYQLMLRKKGHEVARDSEHPRGHAVDFRIPNVPTKILLRYVRSLRLGGVGYYPESKFVHCDVGRVRFWKGH